MELPDKIFFIKGKSELQTLLEGSSKQPLKYILIASIILVTVIKLGLIGTGSLTFPDEFRYFAAGNALQHLSELKIGAAMNDLFSTKSKPGDVILQTIPNAIELITSRIFKLYRYESNNHYPLFIFNFIIYCCILIVHFKFSKLVLKDTFLALVSVLLFSSLTNSYLYLRHVLAYDTSLLIFYWLIYKIVKYTDADILSLKKSTLIGTFSFFGFLVYPGYFPLFFLGLSLLFFNNLSSKNIIKRIYHSSYYIFGSIYCLIVFEAMARLGGVSYISDALHASSIVTQGSPEESFTFLIKYLFEVERITGIILMIGLPIFCFVMIKLIKNKTFKQNTLIMLLGTILIGFYLAYASVGYFFHNFYLMGRTLHQYFPFFCIFSLFAINKLLIKMTKKNELVLFFISLVVILNFGINFTQYYSISYPRDIYWKLSKTYRWEDIENVLEYTKSWSVMPEYTDHIHYPNIPIIRGEKFPKVLVTNCCYAYPVNNLEFYHKFTPNDNYNLLATKTHWLNFKAYQFEACSITERNTIDKINLQIKIFSKQ